MAMAAQRTRDFIEPFMGERVLADIRPDDVREYRLWLQQKDLAPRTVRHLLTDLRCLFRWAVESEHLTRSPFPRGVMPRIQETSPEPQAFIVRLALATGLRWGELCRAEAAHVEGAMLVVSQTKSTRVRRVPLSPALIREILSKSGRLVPYTQGSAGSFSKFVRRHSGVARFHVHQLRHTFACRWVEAGGTLASLQQILGHASVVTTQHYARLSDESVRREAERVRATGADLVMDRVVA